MNELSLSTIEKMRKTLMIAGISTGDSSLEGFAAEANRHVLEICSTLINKIQARNPDTITVNRTEWEHLVKEHKSLKEWVDKAFVAHPNLDLDVEAVEKGNI